MRCLKWGGSTGGVCERELPLRRARAAAPNSDHRQLNRRQKVLLHPISQCGIANRQLRPCGRGWSTAVRSAHHRLGGVPPIDRSTDQPRPRHHARPATGHARSTIARPAPVVQPPSAAPCVNAANHGVVRQPLPNLPAGATGWPHPGHPVRGAKCQRPASRPSNHQRRNAVSVRVASAALAGLPLARRNVGANWPILADPYQGVRRTPAEPSSAPHSRLVRRPAQSGPSSSRWQ